MPQPSNRTAGTPARRRGRWERYRVTHPFSPGALAGLWGVLAGLVALAALLGWALEMRGGVVLVVAMPFVVAWFENRRTAFQFDAGGVRVGDLLLPWADVTQFVVATPENREQALLGVRLRSGATLPPETTATRQDPAMPAPVHVAVQRSKFDLEKMVHKARKYAPPHIGIVVAEPSGERAAA